MTAARRTPLKRLLGKARTLRPQFSLQVERLQRTVTWAGAEIEIALDIGEVEGHGRRAPVAQLELELKAGGPAALFALARSLSVHSPLRLTFETKADMGYRLQSAEAPAAVKSKPPPLTAGMTTGEAFAAIAAACLRQVAVNERVLRLHRRPEALHQMRVGLRRLRSALILFRPIVADDGYEAAAAELKWLTGQLDEARDVDVFVAETYRPGLAALGSAQGLTALGKRLRQAQTRAYDRAVKALKSGRGMQATLVVAEWLETGAWRGSEAAQRPVGPFAREALDSMADKLARRGRRLEELDPERRHKVRLAGKKLRYGLDFFSSLYAKKPARRFAEALKALQQELGELNDIAVGQHTAAQVGAAAPSPDIGFAAGLVAGLRTRDETVLLKKAARAHRAVRRADRPW